MPGTALRPRLTSAFASVALLLPLLLLGCKSAPTESADQSAVPKNIYSTTADAAADINAAIAQAQHDHKRILLDFGGNWCGDCLVLDFYLHQNPNAPLLEKNFLLVHVDIGQYDHNLDIAQRYQVPVSKGVPALAVLDSNGQLLYSQQNKEFEQMRSMNPASVTEFLNRWKS